MDYAHASNCVAETLEKAGEPLTESQKMLLAGAMAVWLEKARKDGLDWAKNMAAHCKKNGINYP